VKNEPVDALKDVLGVASDQELASVLGLERSAIAQWRRRKSIPARYRLLLDSTRRRKEFRYAVRRLLYGDSEGRYLLAATLAWIPASKFDMPKSLSPANVGWTRETLILNVAEAIIEVCDSTLGKRTCTNDDEYLELMHALAAPPGQKILAEAFDLPVVGEL
jgi:transcriptional regulator with XRE-family HTH domain